MPVFDWQFLVVTMVAAGAGSIVLRRLLPARKVRAKGADAPPAVSVACSHCASSESSAAKPARPARTETVPVVSLRDLRESAHQNRGPQNQAPQNQVH
jgi:hypothetical protein